MVKPKISLIAVIAENNALGKDNKLLWHLPEDLQKFKRLTFNHPIIMGRKTFESIGRSLPGRLNIVISRDKNYKVKSGLVFNDLGKAILFAQKKDKQEVFIIGGGDDKERLMELAKKLKTKNITFTGYIDPRSVEEFRQFYRRANVFVFPSIWDEPLGLVALEAMASCTPVVGSKKGGISMAVKNDQTGYLVRAKSPKQITVAVNKILADPELEKRLGENARKLVEEKFNLKKIARKFHDIYSQAYENSIKRKKTKALIGPKELERERREVKGKRVDYI